MTEATACQRRRDSLLREMGLAPIWRLRQPGVAAGSSQGAGEARQPAAAQINEPEHGDQRQPAPGPSPLASVAPDAAPAPAPAALDVSVMDGAARAAAIAGMNWQELRSSVAQCQACALHRERQQAVFGVGDETADWLFVGEGPGAEEDLRGEPFVGQAGKLLDAMLAAIGLVRGRKVYIANAVKCRPAANRTPTAEEMAACRPYLERQIALLQPRLIVALGRPATQTLLGQEITLSAARGRVWTRYGRPLVVTWHPAYLLRSPADKAKAWEDLCRAKSLYQEQEQG